MSESGEDHEDYCLESYRPLFSTDILQGKVAFVTGGGSGIGFRIAELFMRYGCNTVIASRKLNKLEESAYRLNRSTGRQCLPVQVDVRKHESIQKAVATALKKFKKIDILVNGAAGNFLCPASSLTPNGFKAVMEIDTMGTFYTTKALYDQCFKDYGGVVINLSATLHYAGTALQVHAGSAKAAIDAMTKHLAVEWGPQGVRVNCIAPGPIEGTEGMRKLGGASEDARDHLQSLIPLRRLGTRTDIAETAVFLASPLSSYVTGTVLVVDGGQWLTCANLASQVASKL